MFAERPQCGEKRDQGPFCADGFQNGVSPVFTTARPGSL